MVQKNAWVRAKLEDNHMLLQYVKGGILVLSVSCV